MKYHDRPEQRIFDTAVFPCESELPMIGDDGDDEEADDRHGDHTGKQTERQKRTAHELHRADHIGQEQAVLETGALEEFGGGADIAEQDRIAVHGERPARHHADQRLGDRRECAIDGAESRNEQTRLLLHGGPSLRFAHSVPRQRDRPEHPAEIVNQATN